MSFTSNPEHSDPVIFGTSRTDLENFSKENLMRKNLRVIGHLRFKTLFVFGVSDVYLRVSHRGLLEGQESLVTDHRYTKQ